MDNSTKLVVHERPSVYADQRLNRRAKVVRSEIAAVGKLDVDQAIDRNCRVSRKLDKGVKGEGEAVVKFVCQILEQTGVINRDIKCEVGGVDEVRVLPAMCLGHQHHCWGALDVTIEFRLYHLSIFRTGNRISR